MVNGASEVKQQDSMDWNAAQSEPEGSAVHSPVRLKDAGVRCSAASSPKAPLSDRTSV